MGNVLVNLQTQASKAAKNRNGKTFSIANPQSNAAVSPRSSVGGFGSSARIFFCERCKCTDCLQKDSAHGSPGSLVRVLESKRPDCAPEKNSVSKEGLREALVKQTGVENRSYHLMMHIGP